MPFLKASRANSVLWIGDDIRLMVVDVRGNKVRIGIQAPKGVAVHREEVYEAIKAANKSPKTTIGNTNNVINVRPVAAPNIAARKEVVSMT